MLSVKAPMDNYWMYQSNPNPKKINLRGQKNFQYELFQLGIPKNLGPGITGMGLVVSRVSSGLRGPGFISFYLKTFLLGPF